MKLSVVSVFDNVAEVYSNPAFVRSPREAVRGFEAALLNPEHAFCKHPEHYSLFHVGFFDDNTAEFELLAAPQLLRNAWEVRKQ